jgi:hypothetical protein
LNCRKVNNLLSAYIDGELGGVEQLQIRQHLRDCPCCTEEHDTLLSTKRLLSGLCMKHPSIELEQRILARLNEADDCGAEPYGMRVRWAMLPNQYHRWSRMGAFCVTCSVAVALLMVAVTPPKDDMEGANIAKAPPVTEYPGPAMPVRDAVFIHSPMESAPPISLRQVSVEGSVPGVRP